MNKQNTTDSQVQTTNWWLPEESEVKDRKRGQSLKGKNFQLLERVWRKGNPLTLLVGMQTSAATMENSVEIP